eukprot:gene391-459_t
MFQGYYALPRYPHLIDEAVHSGSLDIVKLLASRYGQRWSGVALTPAVQSGSIELVKMIFQDYSTIQMESLQAALWQGNLEIIDLLASKYPITDHLVAMSVGCGNLSLVISMIGRRKGRVDPYYQGQAIQLAVRHGYLDILWYLINEQLYEVPTLLFDYAAHNGDLSMAKILWSRIKPCPAPRASKLGVIHAASTGNLPMLQFLVDTFNVKATGLEEAALNGHFETVLYLLSKGAKCFDKTLESAIRGGNLKILKHLCQLNGFQSKLKFPSLQLAVKKGHRDVVGFLLASIKHLENNNILNMLRLAATNGHVGVLEDLIYYHATQLVNSPSPARSAAIIGDVQLLSRLHKQGYPCSDILAFGTAASKGHLSFVQYLFEDLGMSACTRKDWLGSQLLQQAATNNHLSTVQYLVYNKIWMPTPSSMNQCSRNGHVEMLEYLLDVDDKAASRKSPGKIDLINWSIYASQFQTTKFLFQRFTYTLEELKSLSTTSSCDINYIIRQQIKLVTPPSKISDYLSKAFWSRQIFKVL